MVGKNDEYAIISFTLYQHKKVTDRVMSFPGSLANRAMRQGLGGPPAVKRAGGRVDKRPQKKPGQARRERQTVKERDRRQIATERYLAEAGRINDRVHQNTGRGRQRGDGMHSRLPRERRRQIQEDGLSSETEEDDDDEDDLDFEEELRRQPNLSSARQVMAAPTRNTNSRRRQSTPEDQQKRSRRQAPPVQQERKRPQPQQQQEQEDQPPRVFVATPCFDSPLTRHISSARLDEYARLCAADAQLNFQESPLVARYMVCMKPRTITPPKSRLLSEEKQKEWLTSWLSVSDKICLYTDLGVSPYLTEIIKFATANNIPTEFRLLGEAWIKAKDIPLDEERGNVSVATQQPTVEDQSPSRPAVSTQTVAEAATPLSVDPVVEEEKQETKEEAGDDSEDSEEVSSSESSLGSCTNDISESPLMTRLSRRRRRQKTETTSN